MSPEIHANNLRNRYPGVKPFTVEERELFFGREKDISNLYDLLTIKQMVVLYGKSGYGKSSLLNAGIIPRFARESDWACFSIRFNNFSERVAEEMVSPVENIKLRLKQDVDSKATAFLDAVIPGEDSLWYWIKARQAADNTSQFIFFFDQFEELFTHPEKHIEEFSDQLSHLLYNTVPSKFRKQLAEMDEQDQVSDELHEYFYHRPDIKVVFSVRSDRLSLLNLLTKKHPAILKNCYELDALSKAEAQDAIIKPAGEPQSEGFRTPPFQFTEEAVDKIIRNISNPQDGKIETATLQIICRYIESELVERKNISTITGDQLGDIADIFRQYYEGVLARFNPIEKQKAQRLIEDELIEDGRRNTLTDGHIKRKLGYEESLLQQLEQSSLLRKERDAAGRILYEISHDSLVQAIEKVAQNRRRAEEEARRDELEKTLQEERERANELAELNSKFVFRTRLAVGLAIVSFVVAVLAVYFYREANIATDKATSERKEAEVQAQNAKVALFRNQMQEAKMLLNDVNNAYMLSQDYELARQNLQSAESMLRSNIKLPEKEEREKTELLATINKLKNNLPNPE